MKSYNTCFLMALISLSTFSIYSADPRDLYESASAANLEGVKKQLAQLADDPKIQNYKDQALVQAVQSAGSNFGDVNKAVIEYLISQGANINSTNPVFPALHAVLLWPHKNRLAYVLTIPGIDVNIIKYNINALGKAVDQVLGSKTEQDVLNYFDMIGMLLDKGANAQVLNEQGNAPIHTVLLKMRLSFNAKKLKEAFTKIAKLLIKSGNSLNTQNSNGQTPLHLAVIYKKPDMVEYLVNLGADTSIKDRDNKTPLDRAHAALNEISAGRDPRRLNEDANYRALKDILYLLQPAQFAGVA